MSQNQLFSEFIASTKGDWQTKAALDLKGKQINSLANNWYGLDIEPYYAKEDIKDADRVAPLLTSKTGWINYVRIDVETEEQANKLAREALGMGATGIVFESKQAPDYAALLDGIELEHCAIAFSGNVIAEDFIKFATNNNQVHNLSGFINQAGTNKPIGSKAFFPTVIHGASSNELIEIQEILSQSHRLLASISIEEASLTSQSLAYQVQMTTNYFFGIAKIRALRILLSKLYSRLDLEVSTDEFHIIAISAPWLKPEYEPHENMLKATSSAMAAVMGGCNSLIISPGYKDVQEELVARNISSILEFESYLDKVADPAAGSYFIEHLTADIVSKVWDDFIVGKEDNIDVDTAKKSKTTIRDGAFDSAESC